MVTGGYFIYEGTYHIYAGRDALCEAAAVDIRINGRDFAERDLSHMTCVYACDDYENSEFVQGCFGMTAAENDGAVLTFMKSRLPRDAEKMALLLYSEESGGVDIIWNGKTIAMWRGNTSSPERKMTAYELPSEYAAVPWRWPAYWTEAICVFDSSCREETGTLKLKLKGDVRLLSLKSL